MRGTTCCGRFADLLNTVVTTAEQSEARAVACAGSASVASASTCRLPALGANDDPFTGRFGRLRRCGRVGRRLLDRFVKVALVWEEVSKRLLKNGGNFHDRRKRQIQFAALDVADVARCKSQLFSKGSLRPSLFCSGFFDPFNKVGKFGKTLFAEGLLSFLHIRSPMMASVACDGDALR